MSHHFRSLADREITTSNSKNKPLLTLRIIKGQTQYRTREIFHNRYLIGSAVNCDLQFGDARIPKLHSILLYNKQRVLIEAVADAPALMINNRKQIEATLNEGDIIEIGNFAMQVDKIGQSSAEQNPTMEHDKSLADLSAVELVNQIETELKDIERAEQQKQMGISALMEAIKTSGSEHAEASTTPLESHYQDQIEQIINCLQELSDDLDNRAKQISQREQQYLSAASKLLTSQQQLTGQLETITDHLPHILPQLQHRRASA